MIDSSWRGLACHEEVQGRKSLCMLLLILEYCKNMFPPRRLCVCLGNTLLKLLRDFIDLHAGAKIFCFKKLMRSNFRSHVFLSLQQHRFLFACIAWCFQWLILDSPDKKWALTLAFLCGFWQALSTIQGHLKWWLLYDIKIYFFSYRTIKVEIYDWDRDGRWLMHTQIEKDTNFLIFVLSFIYCSVFTIFLYLHLLPLFSSHDFIGEFTTSYKELCRGQGQSNVYEVRGQNDR